jgi:hypothetical protein
MRKKSSSNEEFGYTEADLVEVVDMEVPESDEPLQELGEPDKEASSPDPIKEKIEEVRSMVTDYNLLFYRTDRDLAERAIKIGLTLHELKSQVKMSDERWELWAEENLPFIGKRNRQKYMLLAKRKDCHPYTDMGVDRLEALCSATKDLDGENPIGTLLSKYAIVVDETSDYDLDEFKAKIDSALNSEKLEKRNIPVSFEVVDAVTRQGMSFDKKRLQELSTITKAGGDPEDHLRSLSMRGGKDESKTTGEVKLQDFNTLANRMIRTIEYILRSPEQFSMIDPNSLIKLIQKLIALQTAANIAVEQTAANIGVEQAKAA